VLLLVKVRSGGNLEKNANADVTTGGQEKSLCCVCLCGCALNDATKGRAHLTQMSIQLTSFGLLDDSTAESVYQPWCQDR
jgi:hypothetical protein